MDEGRELWKDIERFKNTLIGPWGIIGDFNNVLKTTDRIGGREMTDSEFVDMKNMMEKCEVAEMDSERDYYIGSNKHSEGAIYSRIDRVLGNLEWMQKHDNSILTVMVPSVSDHSFFV